jgi:hypothetical protein
MTPADWSTLQEIGITNNKCNLKTKPFIYFSDLKQSKYFIVLENEAQRTK